MNRLFIGNWQVIEEQHLLVNRYTQQSFQLEPKVMQALCLLIKHPNRPVSRDTFKREIWSGKVVVDEALSRVISELRKALGGRQNAYIKTIPKKGYMLVLLPEYEDVTDGGPTETVKPLKTNQNNQYNKLKYTGIAMVIAVCLVLVNQFPPTLFNSPSSTDEHFDSITQQLNNSLTDQSDIKWQASGSNSGSYIISRELARTDAGERELTFTIKQQTGQAIWEISAPVNQPSDIQQIAQALVKGLALIGTAVQPPEVSELIVTSQSTYTRAWYFFDQRTEASLTKAIELFDMVLNQYPQHIPSLMGKASAFSDLTRFEKKKKEESVNYQMSRLLFQQAKGIAPAHPRVIGSEYSFDFSKGDWAFHEQKLKHLIADDPTCRDCILSLVRFYWIVGWYQESERLLERQLEYFPLSVQLHSMLARTYARTGKVDAIETQNELIMLFGSHSTHDAHTAQANAAYARGDGQTWLSVQRQFIPAESPVAQIVMPFLEAIVADDIAEMKRLSEFFPDGAFFNFRLNVGQIEPLIERIEQGIAANDYFDFAQIHGFRTPRNELTKHYVDRLIEFQNNSRVSDIFIEQGLLAFWQQTQKWPDYCYLETRPMYFEGANSL